MQGGLLFLIVASAARDGSLGRVDELNKLPEG